MTEDLGGHTIPTGGGFGKARIEALSDGIFAVAMTLLVLDVKLPGDESFATDGALLERLLSLEHTFVIYFISFVVLGMFWVGHHAQFHFVRYVDHTLLWLNLFFLFGITSIPFGTDLLGDYHELRLPYMIYGFKLMLLAGLLVIQVVYLLSHPELAQPSLTRGIARRMIWRAALFATIPLLSMAAVFYNTRLGLYLYFLLAVVHFLPGRIDKLASPGADDA
jgi:uncharacterized membrane protein